MRQVVLDEHRQQDAEHLLLAARQLIGHQRLADLRETDFVFRAHDGLPRVLEQVVDHVLKQLLGPRDGLRLLGGVGPAALQHLDDAVADVHLIVEILALQLEELPVQLRGQAHVHLGDGVRVHERAVERADDVETDVTGVGGFHLQVHPLEHVAGELAPTPQASDHLVDDRTLANAVHSTQNVDLRIEIPHDVLHATPKGIDFDLLDINCVLLHISRG